MSNYKVLTVRTPANGRLRKSTVLAVGKSDEVLFTDAGDLASALERKKVSLRIAKRFEMDELRVLGDLDQAWNDVAAQFEELQSGALPPEPGPPQPSLPGHESNTIDPLAATPLEIREEASALLRDVELVNRIVADVETLGVAGEKELIATIYLVGVSRLLSNPLSAIVQGPSSSGKSYLVEKVAELFPPEAIIHATQMTPQALFHMRPGALSHRWIVGGERSRQVSDESAEATRALREMQSSGRLSKMMPVKVPGGSIETVQIVQDGPIAFTETTTMTQIFDEDENRCLMLHTDERKEQTRRIIDKTAASFTATTPADTSDLRSIHHALQRMLQVVPVVVPFADLLGKRFPCERVEARCAFAHVLDVIRACALLHQCQRPTNEGGCLVAQPKDYHIARRLLAKPLARLIGDAVSDPARRFYEILADRWPFQSGGAESFTINDAKKAQKVSKSAVRGWIAELHESGALRVVEEGRGRKPAVWQLTDSPPSREGTILPTVEDLFAQEEGAIAHNPQVQSD